MQKAYCPQIEGLHLKDLIQFINSHDHLEAYFPKEEEIPKCGREWVANVLQTKYPEEFKRFVHHME